MDVAWFRAREALVLDSGGPLNTLVYGAPSSIKFNAVVRGQAAHAGSNPEDGLSAIFVASQAIANMRLGRIDHETTANIGMIQGGSAVNIVPDRVEIYGESRSHDNEKLDAQIASIREALEDATAAHQGAGLEWNARRTYESYRLSQHEPIIQQITDALLAMGEGQPTFRLTGGGSDANILNARGITAMPISTGMQSVHTNDECIAVSDMARCAELVLRLLSS
jgi:tripeptide aminopeptidase